jgi:hypothetical protein
MSLSEKRNTGEKNQQIDIKAMAFIHRQTSGVILLLY